MRGVGWTHASRSMPSLCRSGRRTWTQSSSAGCHPVDAHALRGRDRSIRLHLHGARARLLSTERVRNAVDESVRAPEKSMRVRDVSHFGEFVFNRGHPLKCARRCAETLDIRVSRRARHRASRGGWPVWTRLSRRVHADGERPCRCYPRIVCATLWMTLWARRKKRSTSATCFRLASLYSRRSAIAGVRCGLTIRC
jgi:hypothetical protein